MLRNRWNQVKHIKPISSPFFACHGLSHAVSALIPNTPKMPWNPAPLTPPLTPDPSGDSSPLSMVRAA